MNIKNLEKIPFLKKIYYFDTITSTNEKAKEMLPLENYTLFIAETQTKGKGRNQREWYSPAKKNLYFSYVLKIENELYKYSSYPLIVAYSIFKIIKKYISNKKIYIKWPNDIYVENRKISGILIEIINNHIITGIGFNINSENFPVFENNNPTSLYIESKQKFDRTKILTEFFYEFNYNFNIFLKEFGLNKNILDEINNNLKYKNETIEIIFKDSKKKGILKGINNQGFLLLNNNEIIYAGDVLKLKSCA